MPIHRVVPIACCALFLVLAAAQYPPVTVRAGVGFRPFLPRTEDDERIDCSRRSGHRRTAKWIATTTARLLHQNDYIRIKI